MSGLEIFLGVFFIALSLFMTYVGMVIQEEQRTGQHIPLIWEKEHSLWIRSDKTK